MGTVQNVSGEDYGWVPLLGRGVNHGETVDVNDGLLDPAKNLWPEGIWLVNGQPHKPVESADPVTEPEPPPIEIPAEPAPVEE
jgi:hypothetical protein